MSVSLIPGELKAHQPDGFMGRIRALGTEQKAEKQNAVSAVPSHGRKKTGISLSGVKGRALLFIQQTCAMHLSRVLNVLWEIIQVKVSTMKLQHR